MTASLATKTLPAFAERWSTTEIAIETSQLTKRFGDAVVVDLHFQRLELNPQRPAAGQDAMRARLAAGGRRGLR